MTEYVIHTLSEYIDKLQTISVDFQLSRGQSSDKPLLPTALRCDTDGKKLYSNSRINSFVEEFKSSSLLFLGDQSIPSDYYEWMVIAQHFGIPTQLLDFTCSHIISLMFAVEKAFDYGEEDESVAVVWFLNPQKLNSVSVRRMEIIDIVGNKDVLGTSDGPVAVSSPQNNKRMKAQDGLFVYFPYESESLEAFQNVDDLLIKIVIPHQDCKAILASLFRLGIRFFNLYPELSSITKDILLKNKVTEYLRDNNEISSI